MRIRWTPEAASDLDHIPPTSTISLRPRPYPSDLDHIKDYLIENYPDLAQRTILRLYDAVRSLRRMPHRGRPGREANTRELVLAPLPYIVAYRVQMDSVEILHVHHGAQQRP